MRKLSTIAAAAAALLLLAGCSGGAAPDSGDASPSKPSTLRLAAVVANNSFDPAQLGTGNAVQYWQPVYDTLLVLDTKSQLRPNLATEWSYDDTMTKLSLTLRDGVEFTDGTAFDAAAVKANIEHIAAGSGSNAYMLANVASVDAVSDTRVTITLSRPDRGLLGYLTTVAGAVASPAALDDPELATEPVGSGPYVFNKAKSVAGATYVYDRNEDYWGAKSFPYDSVTVTVMEDATARLNALRSGEIDGALADVKSATEAEKAGLTLNTQRLDWTGLLIADRTGSKVGPLGDVRVRQALNYAIDRSGFLKKALDGRGAVTTQIFNEKSLAFEATLDKRYPHDVKKAKKLLADAGYADGFTLTMPEWASPTGLGAILAQEFADIGVTVEYAKVVMDQYTTAARSGEYGAFIMQLSSGDESRDVSKSLTPGGSWNPLHTEDPEVARLVAEAQAASSDDEYTDRLQELNEYIVDQAWFAPIAFIDTIYLTVDGVTVTPQPQNVVPSIRNFS